jgi:hypothetical protein
MLTKSMPDRAKTLLKAAEREAQKRYELYYQLANQPV